MTAATGAGIATGLTPGWIEPAAFAEAVAVEPFLDVDDLPSAHVLIDTTREIRPGGSLRGAADA